MDIAALPMNASCDAANTVPTVKYLTSQQDFIESFCEKQRKVSHPLQSDAPNCTNALKLGRLRLERPHVGLASQLPNQAIRGRIGIHFLNPSELLDFDPVFTQRVADLAGRKTHHPGCFRLDPAGFFHSIEQSCTLVRIIGR